MECASAWLRTPTLDFGRLLRDKGYLDGVGASEIRAAADACESPRGLIANIDAELREALLNLEVPPELRTWLLGLVVRGRSEPAFAPSKPGERYEMREEIARGGLGRVVAAFDRDLQRDVAVKLVIDGIPAELGDRFIREARLTARLEHPNIVPVHDFGFLEAGGGEKRLFLCMKRIQGRDLREITKKVAEGDAEISGRFTRLRLLGVFQDICLGVAYAHSKGIIHRDLKPSNVMIGDFGETLIVDWGLAKVIGERDGGASGSAMGGSTDPEETPLTLDGDVLGTPAFLAPEQAEGRMDDLDFRTDVFALGAILYSILTWRPPYSGTERQEMIAQAKSGQIVPASARVDALIRFNEGRAPEPVPVELDAVCMKALAFRKQDRHASALELHQEVQLFLEGVQERQRKARQCGEAVQTAHGHIAMWKSLEAEAAGAHEAARALERKLRPLDDKSSLWQARARARSIERDAAAAFVEASSALTVALSHQPANAAARQLMADLYWEKFREAEEAGDEKALLLHKRTVEQHDDGPYRARLVGDGTLSVRTRAYSCACLSQGREANPSELVHQGFHPWSGRALDGRPELAGIRELEPAGAENLRVHGPGCSPVPLVGAEVWLFAYQEIDGLLIPVTPEGPPGKPVPEKLVKALFPAGSPFVPRGQGRYLGPTPFDGIQLPMGSYLLLIGHEGRGPLRRPVFIARCASVEAKVTLFGDDEVPDGFVPMIEGEYFIPSDGPSGSSGVRFLPDMLVSIHPVTAEEYAAFLRDVPGTRARPPREAPEGDSWWPGPPWAVPTAAWLAKASPETRGRARRLPGVAADWEGGWPVTGVSWDDALRYCEWKRRRDRRPFTLLLESEREKCARGADRRVYPFGNQADERWANLALSHPGSPRPAEVQEFPADESPWGVRGTGGNSRDMCLDGAAAEYPGWRMTRGGMWQGPVAFARVSYRSAAETWRVHHTKGFRLACPVRLPSGP
ncbi:MAG: serine/threonine protein kinase [Planctomycetota bacterium]|nr:MAG: serine/threonine protein kinase [Planctomycetota bacterium]